MQFAWPPDGLRVIEKPKVQETLDALRDECEWLDRAYSDAILRLEMSGHNEGKKSETRRGLRSVVEVNPTTGQKRLGISYIVLGDKLTVLAIRILAFDGGEISN